MCVRMQYVFFGTYVQIHQIVFDKNTCRIRTNRFTDGGGGDGLSPTAAAAADVVSSTPEPISGLPFFDGCGDSFPTLLIGQPL